MKVTKPSSIPGQTKYCPTCGSYMRRVNLSETHARKGCAICKRAFTYIRTDTPDGLRAYRAARYDVVKKEREARKVKTEPKPTLTNAERQRAYRLRQKQAAAGEPGGEVIS